MPEPEEDCINRSKEQRLNMDLDLDLDNSWPLDQISFFSTPTSPFLLSSSSDQPSSPLWAFSPDDFRPPSSSAYPIYLTCNTTNSATEIATVNDDNRKFHPPVAGLLPRENLDSHCIIKERMALALRYFKESTEQHVLAQVWTPVKKGGRYVLTTLGQPFILDPYISGLNHYRMVSLTYMFSVDGENDVELGLPGRVFRQKLPEWTPDVQYYSSKEYSRLDHALHYNVRGTLALPVFEPSRELCVGVLELIMTSQKINYAPEVDKVCKALEAVNLKSSQILDHTNTQICNEGRKNALAENLEILTVVCETHKLPLAQTWVPCMHGSVLANGGGLKKSCTSFDGSCSGRVCMSTTDVAFYVVDGHMWGFREACLEHHLQKGQGVAGRAFLSHSSCFCPNITQSCKTHYPLVHYARMFGLKGSFAICLRSSYTGDDDYILEFFLPPSITSIHEQKSFVGLVLATIRQHFRSLKVASGMDLEDEEGFVEVIQFTEDERIDLSLECVRIPPSVKPLPVATKLPDGGQRTHLESLKPQSNIDLGCAESGWNIIHANGNNIQPLDPERKIKKQLERKRGKTEKSISLEVLQQYFAGSLKDAAKSLGVCPTTMKRICRQHGISRWPSRKINKVNRSLSKLKRVIESVHGAEGAFSITPLGASPLPVAVGSISWNSNLHKGGNQHDLSNCKSPEPQSDRHSSPACKTPVSDGRVQLDQLLRGRVSSRENPVVQNGCSPEVSQHSNGSKSASGSGEGSVGAPTSQGSCQGSPAVESMPCKDPPVSPIEERATSPEMVFFPTGNPIVSAAYSIAKSHGATEALKQLGAMLTEDAGSSKDLRNLCPSVADAIVNERAAKYNWRNPPCSDVPPTQTVTPFTEAKPDAPIREESRIITIKATYKEDIIRFRITLGSAIMELKEEVAKRFKLDVGTFDIKYLDDDHEWVLIACDADLLECVNTSRSSGSSLIRLSVHDASPHHGSSCESTEEP